MIKTLSSKKNNISSKKFRQFISKNLNTGILLIDNHVLTKFKISSITKTYFLDGPRYFVQCLMPNSTCPKKFDALFEVKYLCENINNGNLYFGTHPNVKKMFKEIYDIDLEG